MSEVLGEDLVGLIPSLQSSHLYHRVVVPQVMEVVGVLLPSLQSPRKVVIPQVAEVLG